MEEIAGNNTGNYSADSVPAINGTETAEVQEPNLEDENEFRSAVDNVYAAIHGNDESKDRAIAEIYVFMRSMEQGVRKMVAMGGPMGLLKNMVAKGGE